MKWIFLSPILLALFAEASFKTDTAPYAPIAGKMVGLWVVKDLSRDSGLSKAGVKAGDIITAVDGNTLFNRQAAEQAYYEKSIKSVVVLRSGRKIKLEIK